MSNKSQHLTLEQWKVLAEYQQACTILNGMYDDPDYYLKCLYAAILNQISYCDRLLYNCTKLGVDPHDSDASWIDLVALVLPDVITKSISVAHPKSAPNYPDFALSVDYDASDGFTTISGNEGFMVRGRIHVHPDQLEALSKVFTYLAQLYKSSR